MLNISASSEPNISLLNLGQTNISVE
uniref:Uncharacterized protein n=1 Tax=Anguilla anguilla TaxID=7936 RepID=A0A0E9U8B1_ANGAN